MTNPLFSTLSEEDYTEPRCPLAIPGARQTVPTDRILQKLDEYLSRDDYASAEEHLRYWLVDAEASRDDRGRLTIVNEQIGLYRKTGKPAEAFAAIDAAFQLADQLDLADTIVMGTTLVNVATAYKAFSQPEKALPLYERAKMLFESLLDAEDRRLAALYNNMALTEMELDRCDQALSHFHQALGILSHIEGGEADAAITYCNLADLSVLMLSPEASDAAITRNLQQAMALLNTESLPRDGYYAFVCEKCAPTFGLYGFEAYEKELSSRARSIYERA